MKRRSSRGTEMEIHRGDKGVVYSADETAAPTAAVTIDLREMAHEAELYGHVRKLLAKQDIHVFGFRKRGQWVVQARESTINKQFDNPYTAMEYALGLLAGGTWDDYTDLGVATKAGTITRPISYPNGLDDVEPLEDS